MSEPIAFALNHITTPSLPARELVDLAQRLGCVGVELRNDLVDKHLTERPFFDGDSPAAIGDYVRNKGLRLLGLSEVYGFNRWSHQMRERVRLLIDQAKESGAESISLIPSNDGARQADDVRLGELRQALSEILPMLEEAKMTALIEPLGFTTSSLRLKREAAGAIDAVNGTRRFKLVHDTFHHFLAGETEFFPELTGIVHISGVVDRSLAADQMQDGHRILVTASDRLGNVDQIRVLKDAGYRGAYSFECFAASVQSSSDIESELRGSMKFIEVGLSAAAA